MKVQVDTESHKNAQALPDVDRLENLLKIRFMKFQLQT